jgi:hypothetical protein
VAPLSDEVEGRPLGSKLFSSRKLQGVESLGELGSETRLLCFAHEAKPGGLNENCVEGKDMGDDVRD